MAAVRQAIPDFQFANDMYIGGQVTFYKADINGNITANLATLYDSMTGTGTLTNPQKLNSDGKFAAAVYIDAAVIGAVVLSNGVADHRTGVIGLQIQYSGSSTYDPPNCVAGASVQTTVTVTGALVGDRAIAGFSVPNASMLLNAQVTATDTVTVTFTNISAGPIDMASGTLNVNVFH